MLTLLPYHAPVPSSALWWVRDAFLLELLIIYPLPTFIALAKHHPETGKIILVNLLFGWTGIGWLFALIAAVRTPTVMELHVCRNCHSVGIPRVRNAKWFFGSGAWNAAALYTEMVPPLRCARCNAPNPIPVSTPYGQELLRRANTSAYYRQVP